MSKSIGNIQLVNDLTESRAFRSRQDIGKHTADQIGELVYVYCLALATLKNEFKYKRIARQYASRTMSYNNFDYFRTNGTDLYLLVHSLIGTGSIVQFDKRDSSQAFVDRLSKNKFTILDFLNYIEITEVDHSLCNRLLMKLERQFKVNSFQAKKIRRELSVYDLLKMKDKANIVNLVMREIKQFAPRSELYTPLQNMFRERKLSNDDTVKQRKLKKNVGAGAL